MSGPTAPNTTAILNSIKAMLTSLTLADNVTPAYNTVVIGASDDYTQVPLPCVNILLSDDDSMRFAHGGTIVEPTDFRIRSVVDYTDKQAAELQIASIRDALMPILEKYAVLLNTVTVYHSQIKPHSSGYKFLFLKPNWYRAHQTVLTVSQYYVVPGGIQ